MVVYETNLPDYRGRHAESKREGVGAYWWKETKEKIHEQVVTAVRFIDQHQAYKYRSHVRAVSMYANKRISSLGPLSYARPVSSSGRRMTYNIVQSTVDTATAFVAKESPRVVAVTDGASRKLRRRAKKLSKFYYGLFRTNGVFDNGADVFRDGALTGAGHMKVSVDENKKINIERVFGDELIYDDADAIRGSPRSLFHRVWIGRESAAAKWPFAKKAVMAATAAKAPGGLSEPHMRADVIELIEAWHLPSSPDAKDGVHALVVDGATLFKEGYSYPCFPIVSFPYGPRPPKGLFPEGLANKLVSIQISINRHLDTIEESLRRLAVPRVYFEGGSSVSVSQMNNLIGAVVKYDAGTRPPIIDNSNVIPPDLFHHLYWTIEAGFEIAGVSKLSATSQTPKGLDSGAALREFKDIEAVSFSTIQRNYEYFFVDLAKVCTLFAKDLYSEGVDTLINVPGTRFLESVKWSDVCMEDDAYLLNVFPTSMLPKQPAARFAQVDEWYQKQWIDREEALQLMDMPDLEKANEMMTSTLDDIDETIDTLLYGEVEDKEEKAELAKLSGEEKEQREAFFVYSRVQPDPLQNLTLAIKRVRAQWMVSRHQKDVPESRLQLLVDYINQAQTMLQSQEAAAGAVAAMDGAAPAMNMPSNPAAQAMPPPPSQNQGF